MKDYPRLEPPWLAGCGCLSECCPAGQQRGAKRTGRGPRVCVPPLGSCHGGWRLAPETTAPSPHGLHSKRDKSTRADLPLWLVARFAIDSATRSLRRILSWEFSVEGAIRHTLHLAEGPVPYQQPRAAGARELRGRGPHKTCGALGLAISPTWSAVSAWLPSPGWRCAAHWECCCWRAASQVMRGTCDTILSTRIIHRPEKFHGSAKKCTGIAAHR